jgi:PrtD family type I secretion system ABC transporter
MLKQVRRALLAAFVFSGAINVLMLATPLYTLQVFESVVPLDSIETLVVLTLMTGAAIAACALIEIARDMLLLRAGLWLDHELGQHILENGLKLGSAAPELKQDVQALEQFKAFVSGPAITPLFDAPWVPIFLFALAALNPVLGAVAAVAALLLVMLAIAKGMLTGRLQQEAIRSNERSRQWWSTVAGNGQLAGALGLARGASLQWESFNRSHIAASYSLGKRASLVKAATRTVRIGSQIALYGVGAWLIVRTEMTPGVLVASAILLARALAPLEQLVGTMKAVQAALAAYRRLKALPADAVVPRVTCDENGPRGHLVLSDVSYYYPTRKMPALRSVSLSLAPGECLGIAGPNGAGKSTLAAIVAGAAMPTSGAADLDGIPVAKWQRGDGFPPVGYLPDEPALIEGSVHDNIARFGDASLVSSAQAAMRAGVHDTLHNLAQGYDTLVGPGGSGLAFRERRAVALARALHGQPRIVVLDEPEIGLDGTSMKSLVKVLEALKADGIGFVIVTQDPRLIALTDRIVVLNGGAVQSFGLTAELARRMDGSRRQQAEAGLH